MNADADSGRLPLVATRRDAQSSITAISQGLCEALNLSHWVSLGEIASGTSVREFGFVSTDHTLNVTDDRGLGRIAMPVISNANAGQHLLMSLTVSWSVISKDRLRFLGASIIVFIAWGHHRPGGTLPEHRRQLIRLEWEGMAEEGGFEAQIAAHPHWQIDRWTAGYDVARAALYKRLLTETPVQEFGATPDDLAPIDVAWLRRIHLAAGAKWADEPWAGIPSECWMHAYAPREALSIANWVLSALRYLSSQFETAFRRID